MRINIYFIKCRFVIISFSGAFSLYICPSLRGSSSQSLVLMAVRWWWWCGLLPRNACWALESSSFSPQASVSQSDHLSSFFLNSANSSDKSQYFPILITRIGGVEDVTQDWTGTMGLGTWSIFLCLLSWWQLNWTGYQVALGKVYINWIKCFCFFFFDSLFDRSRGAACLLAGDHSVKCKIMGCPVTQLKLKRSAIEFWWHAGKTIQ